MATPGRWGWHELDGRWAQRLVADAGVGPGDVVLDIGAGRGALTLPLVATGARVIAVELHRGRLDELRARVGGDAVVVAADATDLRLPKRPFSVVASPPYGITTPLLRRLLHDGSRLRCAHLVLQDQAARRWAGPSAPAAHRWQRTFEPTLGARVPRDAFSPPPRADSRVLVLRRRPGT